MAGLYKLPWRYCECGCKGYTCLNLWMFDSLNGKWHLGSRHGYTNLGTFVSPSKMETAAVSFLKAEKSNFEKEVDKILEVISSLGD